MYMYKQHVQECIVNFKLFFLEGWVDVGFFYLQDSDTSNRATLNYTVHACIQREVISVH